MARPLELKNTSITHLTRVSDQDNCNNSDPEFVKVHRSSSSLPRSYSFHNETDKLAEQQHQRAQLVDRDQSVTGRSQLRKKPKSDSIASAAAIPPSEGHMRKLSDLIKSSGIKTSSKTVKAEDRSSSIKSTTETTTPVTSLERTPSDLKPHRSSSFRKPPASHSSHGVETFCGPPPSYSTQRTLSQEKSWNTDRGTILRGSSLEDRGNSTLDEYTPTSNSDPMSETGALNNSQISVTSKAPDPGLSSPDTVETESIPTPEDNLSMTTPPTTSGTGNFAVDEKNHKAQVSGVHETEEETKGSSSDERKSEDLFLNIAKTDVNKMAQNERRRSRISLSFLSSSRPSSSSRETQMKQQYSSHNPPAKVENTTYQPKRASLGQHVSNASPRTPLDDQYSYDNRPGDQLTNVIHSADRPQSRSRSISNNEPLRPYQRLQSGRTSRLLSEANYNDRQRTGEHNATESTISTTAPSTVWDELDDLKSRIRKLELTGKLPPSSAAAMSLSERPRTATTAATTLSSSPKNRPGVVPLSSAIEGIPSSIHPLLHEALSNAKPIVGNEVFQKLQATAHDALQLSSMLSTDSYDNTGNASGIASSTERQLRRRTESMCRSLTELTIALSAEARVTGSPETRPVSRQTYAGGSTGFRTRQFSIDPNERPSVTSRVQSRLEGRRTSVSGMQSPVGGLTQDNALNTPPTALSQTQPSSSRLSRTSTLTRSNRTSGLGHVQQDEEEASPSVRPVSRAMTEIGSYRHQIRDRASISRGYTSQYPLPPGQQPSTTGRSPLSSHQTGSSVPNRRQYTSPASLVGTPDSTSNPSRERWGRISIVPSTSTPLEVTPEVPHQTRSASTRRSLGLASKISNVGSRLRAVKAERSLSNAREGLESPSSRDLSSSHADGETNVTGRLDSLPLNVE